MAKAAAYGWRQRARRECVIERQVNEKRPPSVLPEIMAAVLRGNGKSATHF
jgi:hypothetical protein